MTTTRTRIKICGITRPEDAIAAISRGVDALGLVFYQSSPRAVSIKEAREIASHTPVFVSKVGLFVDAEAASVTDVIKQVPLDYLQFHGNEDEAYCAAFELPYIKAIAVRPDLNLIEALAAYKSAAAFLLDAWHPDLAGGTGEVFDWSLLKGLQNNGQALILAGGLNAGNVKTAIKLLKPYAVDVSTGVEEAPGIKSVTKIEQFVNEVNGV